MVGGPSAGVVGAEVEAELAAGEAVEDAVADVHDPPLGPPHQVALEAVAAQQLGQNGRRAPRLVRLAEEAVEPLPLGRAGPDLALAMAGAEPFVLRAVARRPRGGQRVAEPGRVAAGLGRDLVPAGLQGVQPGALEVAARPCLPEGLGAGLDAPRLERVALLAKGAEVVGRGALGERAPPLGQGRAGPIQGRAIALAAGFLDRHPLLQVGQAPLDALARVAEPVDDLGHGRLAVALRGEAGGEGGLLGGQRGVLGAEAGRVGGQVPFLRLQVEPRRGPLLAEQVPAIEILLRLAETTGDLLGLRDGASGFVQGGLVGALGREPGAGWFVELGEETIALARGASTIRLGLRGVRGGLLDGAGLEREEAVALVAARPGVPFAAGGLVGVLPGPLILALGLGDGRLAAGARTRFARA